MTIILTGGVAGPPSVPTSFVDSGITPATLTAIIEPPVGFVHADLVKFVNQGTHLFVSWDDLDNQNANACCLYTAADGALVWQQNVVGSVSHNDIVWAAAGADDWLYLRSQNGAPELSKWDATGRTWVSTRYNTSLFWSWCGGISTTGARSVISAIDTTAPNGWETSVLDGADATPTNQYMAGGFNDFAMGALSADGAIYAVKKHTAGFVIHNVQTNTGVHSNTTAQIGQFDMAFDPTIPGMVAISADGAEAIVLDDVNNVAILCTGGPASYTETVIALPNKPRCCAMSADGTKAVVGSRASDSYGGTPTVTVIDVTNKQIQLTAGSIPVQYPIMNPTTTAHGRFRHIGITDDGSEIAFAVYGNQEGQASNFAEHATAFRASSVKNAYAQIYQPPIDWITWQADYFQGDGSLFAVACNGTFSGTGLKGHVALLALS